MLGSHAAAVFAIQRAVYPPRLLERAEHIVSRASIFPSGSFVALSADDGTLLGYAQAYPWSAAAASASPPSLSDGDAPAAIAAALALPPREALLFVHEVSVYRQGCGVGRALMERCLAAGRAVGLRRAMLVAVLGNAPLWQRVGGFRAIRELPEYAGSTRADDGGEGSDGGAPALAPTPSQASTDTTAVLMEAKIEAL